VSAARIQILQATRRRYSHAIAAETSGHYRRRAIKDRSHRLDHLYSDQPLYFVTFATRDRKSIPLAEKWNYVRDNPVRSSV
jgi:hypothetical protein